MTFKFSAVAFGLAAVFAVPAAMADHEDTKKKSSTSTTTTTEETTPPTTTQSTTTTPADETPPSTTTTTTQTTPPSTSATTTTSSSYYESSPSKDKVVIVDTSDDDKPRVRSGLGLNIFGAAGTNDSSKLGIGGRLEYVMPFGLALGGSYTQHFGGSVSNNDLVKTSVRPLLGEIGWAIPLVRRAVEIRPMVGLGYAFATVNTDANNNNASAAVATSNFDVAPGAKVSFLAKGFEVFTMPKYHIISGNNFFAMELGAGARF